MNSYELWIHPVKGRMKIENVRAKNLENLRKIVCDKYIKKECLIEVHQTNQLQTRRDYMGVIDFESADGTTGYWKSPRYNHWYVIDPSTGKIRRL